MNINKLISGVVVLTAYMYSNFSSANPDSSCDGEQSIFSDYTVKGNKYVAVCYVNDKIRYVFGKDGAKPDILLNVPKDKVEFSLSSNGDQSVTIPNGAYSYTVGEYLRGGPFIQVLKNKKLISEIELGGKVLENNISDYVNPDIHSNSNNSVSNAQPKEPPYGLTVNTETITRGVPVPYGHWKYEIRSNVDGLTVKKATVNRGKCNVIWYTNPNNLKWDDTTTFGVTTDARFSTCKPREVAIETNYGVETFRWKK